MNSTAQFVVDGPAMVSFSGGATSAFMLWLALQAHGGCLPSDVHVLFANTGRERPETLDFVRACAERWSVPVVWLERAPSGDAREVSYYTASRDGEPFDALIAERGYLPNPVTRMCTQELKIRVMGRWMRERGYDHWRNLVGLRHDEPRRVHRMRGPTRERWENSLPLDDAGVTLADVSAFWARQPFRLALRPWEGNCDGCFLKGENKRIRVFRDRPDLAEWWLSAERRTGATFRVHGRSYLRLVDLATRPALPGILDDPMAPDPTDLGDCVCTD